LGYNEFDLRNYDPQIGRWLGADPYDEFASPYTGMGNDPINNNDPTGGFTGGIGCNWGAAACNPFLLGATKGASMAGMGLAFMGHISNFSLYANAGNSILQQQPILGSSTRDRANIIGMKAHQALSDALARRNTNENTPVQRWVTNEVLQSGRKPDVLDNLNKKVWELKPLSWQPPATGNYNKAITQISRYVDELNATSVNGGGYSAGGSIFEVPIVSPQISRDGKYIFIYFSPNPSSGIIYYRAVTLPEKEPQPTPSPDIRFVPKPRTAPSVEPSNKPNPSPVYVPKSKRHPTMRPIPYGSFGRVGYKPDDASGFFKTVFEMGTAGAILYGLWWGLKIAAAPATGGGSLAVPF
jgi:hypothetical protein